MSSQTNSREVEDLPARANLIPAIAERAQFALFLLLGVENDFVTLAGDPGNRAVTFADEQTKAAIMTAIQPLVENPGDDPAATLARFVGNYTGIIQNEGFQTVLNGDRVSIPYSEALVAVRSLYQRMSDAATIVYPGGKICTVLGNVTGIVRAD
jgi:hypothetical protein